MHQTSRVSARAWWAMAVFVLAAIISYSDRQVLGLLVDPIRAELSLRDTDLGLLQGVAFAMVYALASLPLGWASDRTSRRNLVIVGVVIWSLATIACGYASSFNELFLARMFIGIGEASLAPAVISMIADLFPLERRGLAIGLFNMGMIIGGGGAFIVGGGLLSIAATGGFESWPFLQALTPWRVALVVMGFSGILLIILLWTVSEPARRGAVSGAGQSLRGMYYSVRSRRSTLLPLYAAIASVSVMEFGMMMWMPTLLTRRFNFGLSEAGGTLGTIVITAAILGTLIGGLLSVWIIKRWSVQGLLKAAAMAVGFGTLTMAVGFANSGILALALFFLWQFSATCSSLIGITTLQNILPNELRGFGISIAAFLNIIIGLGIGSLLPPLIVESIYKDPTSIGLALSTVGIPMTVLAAWLYRRCASRVDGSMVS